MVCKNTFIKARGQEAFTLAEVLVAIALGLMLITALLMVTSYMVRSFAAMDNYMDLDLRSRQTLDQMSREVRQASQLTSFATNDISLLDRDGNALRYLFDAGNSRLLRVSGGQTNVWLKGCDSLQFSIYQHTPISNTFDAYDPAYVTNTKLLQVSWVCSRQILGAKINTESVQSAKIVIRNN